MHARDWGSLPDSSASPTTLPLPHSRSARTHTGPHKQPGKQDSNTSIDYADQITHVELSIVSNCPVLHDGLLAQVARHDAIHVLGAYSDTFPDVFVSPSPPGHVVLLDISNNPTGAVAWTLYWRRLNPPAGVVVLDLSNNVDLIVVGLPRIS